MLGMDLQLDSAAFSTVSLAHYQLGGPITSPNPRRRDQNRIGTSNPVQAVMFDFDGTLTATPGDRAERKSKINELQERSDMLRPWLSKLGDCGIILGIMSKSSERTILDALERAGLRDLFDGPIVGKALSLEGKAGMIDDMCAGGVLAHLGPNGHRQVLLVDDDVFELDRAGRRGLQTFAAPEDGGLDGDDFREIFEGLGLEPPAMPASSTEVERLWTHGLVGKSLGLSTDPTQVAYEFGNGPQFAHHYELDKCAATLGQGSFGKIRKAVHVKTGAPYAIKLICKYTAGRRYMENFVENDMYTFLLRMSHEVPHPNICGMFDYLMGHRLIWGAQELLEGKDLFHFLRDHSPINETLARRLVKQIFLALGHIHTVQETGIIHRDVKLENLRLLRPDPESDLKLLDFGLSCPRLPEQKRAVVGTLLYMAPEVFSQHYTEQVDVWAAGVVLYIVLTGKPPWMQNLTAKQASRSDISPTEDAVQAALEASGVKEAPPAAAELLRGLLVMEPEKRMTVAGALAHEWLADDGAGGAGEDDDGEAALVRRPSDWLSGVMVPIDDRLEVCQESSGGSTSGTPSSSSPYPSRSPTSSSAAPRSPTSSLPLSPSAARGVMPLSSVFTPVSAGKAMKTIAEQSAESQDLSEKEEQMPTGDLAQEAGCYFSC